LSFKIHYLLQSSEFSGDWLYPECVDMDERVFNSCISQVSSKYTVVALVL